MTARDPLIHPFIDVFTQPAKEVVFRWLQNHKVLEKVESQTLVANNFKGYETDSFSCKVSNKVSSETSGGVRQNCVNKGESPSGKKKIAQVGFSSGRAKRRLHVDKNCSGLNVHRETF